MHIVHSIYILVHLNIRYIALFNNTCVWSSVITASVTGERYTSRDYTTTISYEIVLVGTTSMVEHKSTRRPL